MVDLNDVLEVCSDLDAELSVTTEPLLRKKLIKKHFDFLRKKLKYIVPDFEKGLEWMNVESPLSLTKDVRGKIVILDFFTYCCINCMHVLPDLEALEHVYSVEDGVLVIGVHSAKFDNEKISANILSAILRYDISHPVVNDSSMKLWQKLQIMCWPTFVVIGPSGEFLQTYIGEGNRERLIEFVSVAVDYYKDEELISDKVLPMKLQKDILPDSPLHFPGKICVSKDGNMIAVADTGHHRVLLMGRDGIVKGSIGGCDRGYKDGSYMDARFHSPQGVIFHGNLLYVADTDNHCIRQVDLERQTVSTIAGTSVQGHDRVGGKQGTKQDISSPWDLTLFSSEDGSTDLLLIAMAGTHQIWVYYLQDADWPQGSYHKAGTCLRFAGSGREENRNGTCPEKSGFAQPSGLAVCHKSRMLYVADSESSSVRSVSLENGAVESLVGGEKDPKNLFAYGDRDGIGINAKLQHPLCVSLLQTGTLLVADSYNHKVKIVDLNTKACSTITEIKPSFFNEPGGICVDKERQLVYIADTNNHSIKILNWQTKRVSSLPVLFSDIIDKEKSTPERPVAPDGITVQNEPLQCAAARLVVRVHLNFEEGLHFTEDAPSSWLVWSEDTIGQNILNCTRLDKGRLSSSCDQTLFILPVESSCYQKQTIFFIKLKIFFCDSDNLCKMKEFVFSQPIHFEEKSEEEKELILKIDIPHH